MCKTDLTSLVAVQVSVCELDCGPHGGCEDGGCVCRPGWAGPRCTDRTCDTRCSNHGQCKNGWVSAPLS